MVDRAGTWSGPLPTLMDVYRARTVVRRYLKPTPAIESPGLSERMGCRVIVKCENLQPIGALENHLRHLLGDSRLAQRAVRAAVAHKSGPDTENPQREVTF